MVKVLNVTVDDWIMDTIVEESRPEGMNKSEWVRQLLVQGYLKKPHNTTALGAPKGSPRVNSSKYEDGGIDSYEVENIRHPLFAEAMAV